jgi:hypothetical protein
MELEKNAKAIPIIYIIPPVAAKASHNVFTSLSKTSTFGLA